MWLTPRPRGKVVKEVGVAEVVVPAVARRGTRQGQILVVLVVKAAVFVVYLCRAAKGAAVLVRANRGVT